MEDIKRRMPDGRRGVEMSMPERYLDQSDLLEDAYERPDDRDPVAVSFIEYSAYFAILLGLLYFLTQYVLPSFQF